VEAAVEREASAVVPAAQLLARGRALDNDGPAMRAHVRHAVEPVLLVPGQQERLVEGARKQRERIQLPRDFHEVVVPRVTPGAREETIRCSRKISGSE
jgi:hypothetical protein